MARTCSLCQHAQRDKIDRALAERQPYRGIARTFRVSEDALARHKAHVSETLTKARDAKEIARADTLLASIVTLRQRLETALEATSVAKDVASLARELRETLRLMLELEGRLRQAPAVAVQVNLTKNREWISLQARIIQALASVRCDSCGHLVPAARQAVLAAIEGPDADHHAPAPSVRSVANLDAVEAAVAAGTGTGGTSGSP